MRKLLSLFLAALGVGSFVFGTYMSQKADAGENKISQAKEKEELRKRPILGPVRSRLNARAAENAEEKIGDAKESVATSQVSASWLKGTGIVLFAVGLISFIISFFHKRKNLSGD